MSASNPTGSDTARRYVAVIQDERGYPPPGQLDKAPPDGPKPPELHTVVLVDDYERVLTERDELLKTLGRGDTGRCRPGESHFHGSGDTCDCGERPNVEVHDA